MVVRKTSGKYGNSAVRVRKSDRAGWQHCKHIAVLFTCTVAKKKNVLQLRYWVLRSKLLPEYPL